MPRINFEVRGELHRQFLDFCASEGRGISEVIRGLMAHYNSEKAREAYYLKVAEIGPVGPEEIEND